MKREWPFLALEVLFLVVLLQSNARRCGFGSSPCWCCSAGGAWLYANG